MLKRLIQFFDGDIHPEQPSAFFSNLPTLETQRLILRPMRRSDAADIFAFCKDSEVARYCLWDAHRSMSDSRAYLRYILMQYANGAPGSLGIVNKADNRLFGTIGWMTYHHEDGVTEVGYSMARDMWGHGYMTEALNAVIDLTFDRLPVQRIEAVHDTQNPASGRVMARCGMRFEGVMRQKIHNKGETIDVAMYSILRAEREKMRT